MLLQNIQSELADLIFHNERNNNVKSFHPSLHIYRNNILTSLQNTLSAIYPLIISIVGSDFFQASAMAYIKQYPARSGNLHDFGEYFGQFLDEYEPAKDLMYLSEVASFEWIYHLLYFASDHPGLDLECLQKIAPEQYELLHFTLNPACMIKKFRYPILQIIDLCQKEINSIVRLDDGGVDLLMVRRDFNVVLSPLSPADFVFLKAIANNQSLAQSLEVAMGIQEDFDLMEKLPNWIRDKTIVDCFLE